MPARRPAPDTGGALRLLSSVLGADACDSEGHPLGSVTDLVVDIGGSDDPAGRAAVTGLVVRGPGRQDDERVLGGQVACKDDRWVVAVQREGAAALRPTELLLARDVLDAPAIVASRRRRARVSDVVLEPLPGSVVVAGLDLSGHGLARRLSGDGVPGDEPVVPLSDVHLASPRAHAAQLATDDAVVRRLPADALAEVLTHASLTHAREILAAVDREVGHAAVGLLHPALRDRVTGRAGPPRRMLRFSGWRTHRPRGTRGTDR